MTMEPSLVRVKSLNKNGAIKVSENIDDLIELRQYLINRDDTMLKTLFNYYTFLDMNRINEIIDLHMKNPEKKTGHELLIQEIVGQVTNDENKIKQVMNYGRFFNLNFNELVNLLEKFRNE